MLSTAESANVGFSQVVHRPNRTNQP